MPHLGFLHVNHSETLTSHRHSVQSRHTIATIFINFSDVISDKAYRGYARGVPASRETVQESCEIYRCHFEWSE